jgi:phosphoribosylanthranilate isomerase
MATWIKICGITSLADAELALEVGADAIGLNFVATSKRRVDAVTAAQVAHRVGGAAEVVAVVADSSLEELEALREKTQIRWLQLHGAESVAALARVLPLAYKAVAIGNAEDVLRAEPYAGARLLVDAKVPGELGGTGRSFDWQLVRALAERRNLILAGGLNANNVARALAVTRAWGVDVASGVEVSDNPRQKDAAKLRAFVRAVRDADQSR